MDHEELNNLISELETLIDIVAGRGMYGVVGVIVPSAYTWADVWKKAAEVQKAFKGIRYPTKEQREEAWQRFNSLRDDASKLANREREGREWKSKEYRSEILKLIARAGPNDWYDFSKEAVENMKSHGRMLRDAGNMLSAHKREMLGEHKQECFEAIREMREKQDLWWERLKGEKATRHSAFQSKVRSNLERNYERLCKAKDALQRARAHADQLRSQIDSARSDSFRQRALGWLAEEEDRIADIERSIEQIEGWIKEDEDKLE